MLGGGEYSLAAAAEAFPCMNELTSSKKKKNKNKRRFSDEQIRSLELMFESESRLEPRKKLQLASELGLQPRQVAIWFQNKRARWKSKQLERDYSLLRANYNNLASQFESLKREKQALIIQLQRLNELKRRPQEESKCCGQGVAAVSSIDRESTNGDNTMCESEVKPSLSVERSEHGLGVLSEDDSGIKTDYFGIEEEPSLMPMVELGDSSLSSPKDWGNFDTETLFDQSTSSYPWWDFWC